MHYHCPKCWTECPLPWLCDKCRQEKNNEKTRTNTMHTTEQQDERRELLRQDLEYLGVTMHEPQSDTSTLKARIEALEECLEEAVVITTGARIGTMGTSRCYTPQINVTAAERWRKVLRNRAGGS